MDTCWIIDWNRIVIYYSWDPCDKRKRNDIRKIYRWRKTRGARSREVHEVVSTRNMSRLGANDVRQESWSRVSRKRNSFVEFAVRLPTRSRRCVRYITAGDSNRSSNDNSICQNSIGAGKSCVVVSVSVLPNRRVVGLKENPCGIAAWSVVVANYIFYVCATRAMTNCSPLSVLVGDIVDGLVSALVLPSTSAPVGRDLHSKQIDALVSG